MVRWCDFWVFVFRGLCDFWIFGEFPGTLRILNFGGFCDFLIFWGLCDFWICFRSLIRGGSSKSQINSCGGAPGRSSIRGEKIQVVVQFVGRSSNSWGRAPGRSWSANSCGGEPQVAVQFVGRSSNSWGRAPGHRFTCERSPGHRSLTRRSVTRRSVTRKSVTRRHLRGIKGT